MHKNPWHQSIFGMKFWCIKIYDTRVFFFFTLSGSDRIHFQSLVITTYYVQEIDQIVNTRCIIFEEKYTFTPWTMNQPNWVQNSRNLLCMSYLQHQPHFELYPLLTAYCFLHSQAVISHLQMNQRSTSECNINISIMKLIPDKPIWLTKQILYQ